jgi:hypothetical protein
MTQQVKQYPTEEQIDESRRVLKEMNDKADQVIDEQTARNVPKK